MTSKLCVSNYSKRNNSSDRSNVSPLTGKITHSKPDCTTAVVIPSNQVQTREATCVILGSLLQLFNFYFVIYSGSDFYCAMLGTLSHPETGIPEILSLQRYTQHSHALNFLMLRFLTQISLWHLYYYFNFSNYLNKLLPNSEVA